MAVTFLGDHNLVRFGALRIWAERGLLRIEDSHDGSYEVISVHSGLERMNALSDMLANSREELHKLGWLERQKYDEVIRMLEDMMTVCKKAQVQGQPSDKRMRNALKAARPTTIVVPSGASCL